MSSEMTGTRNRVGSYYNVSMGKIVKPLGKEAPENMEGVTERVNAKGVTVYEIHSDYIVGKLVGLELRQPDEGKEEFGAELFLTLKHSSGKMAILRMKWDSAYGRCFMLTIPNIDLSREFELEPYQYLNQKKGKKVSGLNLFQDGEQKEWAYGTKANPGGMPQLKEITYKGKKTWDNTEQLAFLEGKLKELIQEVKDLNAAQPNGNLEPSDEDHDSMF